MCIFWLRSAELALRQFWLIMARFAGFDVDELIRQSGGLMSTRNGFSATQAVHEGFDGLFWSVEVEEKDFPAKPTGCLSIGTSGRALMTGLFQEPFNARVYTWTCTAHDETAGMPT